MYACVYLRMYMCVCKPKQKSWQKFFLAPYASADIIICTEKANGEAAHLSVIRLNGVLFYVIGSKNVHMVSHIRIHTHTHTHTHTHIHSYMYTRVYSLAHTHTRMRIIFV